MMLPLVINSWDDPFNKLHQCYTNFDEIAYKEKIVVVYLKRYPSLRWDAFIVRHWLYTQCWLLVGGFCPNEYHADNFWILQKLSG